MKEQKMQDCKCRTKFQGVSLVKRWGAAVTLKLVDHKMQDQGDRLSDALPDLLMENGFPYFLK